MDKIKVFIVDDSLVVRSMLTRLINTEEDIEIVGEASSGQGAIIMLDEYNPDVVILESGITGSMKLSDIVKQIKAFNPAIKVILTANAIDSEKILSAHGDGADDFIRKPFQKQTVLRAVRSHFEE